MKTKNLFLILSMAIFSSQLLAADLTIWKKTSSWVAPSLSAGIKGRGIEFVLLRDPNYSAEKCAINMSAFQASAIPEVMVVPNDITKFKLGDSPESPLRAYGSVNYPVYCGNSQPLAWSTVKFYSDLGVWKPAVFSEAEAFPNALMYRAHDELSTGLTGDHYFIVMVVPVDLGGKPFPGALLLARETDKELYLRALMDIPGYGIKTGDGFEASDLWMKLK